VIRVLYSTDKTYMRRYALAVTLLVLSGCAALKSLPFTEDTKRYQVAQAYFENGNYPAAYDAYQAIAASRSPYAEEAKFYASYVLVYYKNPHKAFAVAEQGFEEFVVQYPRSSFAGEASTWLEMLKMFHQTKAGELAREVSSLTARIESVEKELLMMKSENTSLKKERTDLLIERLALADRINVLINEKEALIGKNIELTKDKEGLARDKNTLSKRVEALSKEKAKLIEAKSALEKSLHDLTMVDVKMEGQRKKMKSDVK